MSTPSSIPCPQCGVALAPDAPGGLCPRCLMAVNLATQTVFTEAGDQRPAAPPPLSPEAIARHFPNFEILACLGRGGMGVVYRARQKSLNRLVALKILAPERVQDAAFAQRFVIEAETLARLSHPNIVTIHDFGQTDGLFYLVMELVDGVTLRQLLATDRVAPREALAIVPQICDALQYAHDAGIVHRDIKPENILLDRRGRVKVADFGLAKLVAGSAPEVAGTEPPASPPAGEPVSPALTGAHVLGTPRYMSPEQAGRPSAVDHRADIYSLGVVLYEMLTGELPGQELQPPSRKVLVDVRLDEIVLRALEQKPERRYQQASELKTRVETLAATPAPAETSRPSALWLKSDRARLAVREVPEAAANAPAIGAVTLFADRLVIVSGHLQRSIPLADIHGLGQVVMPFWFNPGGHRYAGVDFTVSGQRCRLAFLAGAGLFRLPGETRLQAAEWLAALQLAIQSATGRELPIAPTPTVMPVQAGWLALWFLLPLAIALPLLGKLLTAPGPVGPAAAFETWLRGALLFALPLLILLGAFVRRAGWPRGEARDFTGTTPAAGKSAPAWPSVLMASVVLTYAVGLVGGMLLVGLQVPGSSLLLLALIALATVGSPWLSRTLLRHDDSDVPRRFRQTCGFIAIFIAVPLIGFALFFLNALLTETGGWNPALDEAIIVPLVWLGAVLLPVCGWRLWREATPARPAAAEANPLPLLEFWQALDAGEYARAWHLAAPYLQRSEAKTDWVRRLAEIRRPLGKAVRRQRLSQVFLQPGQRFEQVLRTTFDTGQTARETVFCARQPDGEWRVEKYEVGRPEPLPAAPVEARPAPWPGVWRGLRLLLLTHGLGFLGLTVLLAFALPPFLSAFVVDGAELPPGVAFLHLLHETLRQHWFGWLATLLGLDFALWLLPRRRGEHAAQRRWVVAVFSPLLVALAIFGLALRDSLQPRPTPEGAVTLPRSGLAPGIGPAVAVTLPLSDLGYSDSPSRADRREARLTGGPANHDS